MINVDRKPGVHLVTDREPRFVTVKHTNHPQLAWRVYDRLTGETHGSGMYKAHAEELASRLEWQANHGDNVMSMVAQMKP